MKTNNPLNRPGKEVRIDAFLTLSNPLEIPVKYSIYAQTINPTMLKTIILKEYSITKVVKTPENIITPSNEEIR